MQSVPQQFARREVLKLAAAAPLAALSLAEAASRPVTAAESPTETAAAPITEWLESFRQPDGGYSWGDGNVSHLMPTFAAVGCYEILGVRPPEPEKLIAFLRTRHPFAIKKLERELKAFEYQQIQGLLWLGADAGEFRGRIEGWTEPLSYPKQYETHGYPVFEYEVMPLVCRRLLGLPAEGFPALVDYLDARRRPDGSFNNTPAADGSGGHVLNTWWGLLALDALDRADEKREETVRWTRDCQSPDGGFTWSPRPFMAGNGDAAYTWAAVRILEMLGEGPPRPEACIEYVLSLRNADGGFGPRPDWDSNPVATYYALDALRALGALDDVRQAASPPADSTPRPSAAVEGGLGIYTIQIEAHGKGSPAEAVDLARALKVHLWGAKNATPGWIEAAQRIADRESVPVTFFVANEEYGTLVSVPGQGTYSHTCDLIAPAGAEIGPSLAKEGEVSWEQFRTRRLDPLQQGGGRLVWQFGENEPLTRLYLDDSLARGGYAAISTFHFGNPDFTNSSPFLKHYQNRIPYVALQDAHGEEPWWWGDQLTGFRTLFLAKEPTWAGWLDALSTGRIAAVRHDAASRGETWRHGPPEVLAELDRRPDEWRWWDRPGFARPAVSVVAVRPEDRFEAARPERGVTLRVRCEWESTAQGLPKSPRVELTGLLLDGREVPTTSHAPGPPSRPTDRYHVYHALDLSPGEHVATALYRRVDSHEEGERTIRFTT